MSDVRFAPIRRCAARKLGLLRAVEALRGPKSTCTPRKKPRTCRGFKGFQCWRNSSRFYIDFLDGLLGLSFLGQCYGKYALFEGRFDLVGFDRFRHFKAAFEGTKVTFAEVVIFFLFFLPHRVNTAMKVVEMRESRAATKKAHSRS